MKTVRKGSAFPEGVQIKISAARLCLAAPSLSSTFMERLHYLHQNPVRAGTVERAEDYRSSSVRFWNGGLTEGSHGQSAFDCVGSSCTEKPTDRKALSVATTDLEKITLAQAAMILRRRQSLPRKKQKERRGGGQVPERHSLSAQQGGGAADTPEFSHTFSKNRWQLGVSRCCQSSVR